MIVPSSLHRLFLVRFSHLALSIFLVTGCVGDGTYVAEVGPAASEIETILLLPLNFDTTPPNKLVRGTTMLEQQVGTYLENTGREVRRVRLGEVIG